MSVQEPQPLLVENFEVTDPERVSGAEMYQLLSSAIVPRPIAFISTQNAQGITNLAPFSFFNAVSSVPPCLCVSITPKTVRHDGKTTTEPKDTLRNILETRQFVVNIVTEALARPMNQCSAEYPYGVSEFQEVGLRPLASLKVAPPRVAESPIHLECELYSQLAIGDGGPGSSTLIVGKIVLAHVSRAILEATAKGPRISPEKLNPLARLGGASYGLTRSIFELPRP